MNRYIVQKEERRMIAKGRCDERGKSGAWQCCKSQSPGQKSERVELFLKVKGRQEQEQDKHTTIHTSTTMKRKLNHQDVPEVAEAVDAPETTETTETPETPETSETASAATPTQAAAATPKKTFAELGLDARLLQAINKEKFAAPTPVQARAIPLALSGKDILGEFWNSVSSSWAI
jgi:hypothetical protein